LTNKTFSTVYFYFQAIGKEVQEPERMYRLSTLVLLLAIGAYGDRIDEVTFFNSLVTIHFLKE
jgi:hypothetical protein